MNNKDIPKTLILVPDLNIHGGVSNYYKTLKLNEHPAIDYFVINTEHPQPALAAIFRLISKYISFAYKLITKRYKVVVVNPSLDEGKSFHRDLVFIFLANLLGRKTIVFFRGWYDPFEEKIKKSKFKKFLFRISYAKAWKYFVLGEVFKNKLLGLGVPSSTPFHIMTTVADSQYANLLNLEHKFSTYKKEVNILFLSRIEKEKGILIAIDAFALFIARFPERKAILTIAGVGRDITMVHSYVENKKIPRINFAGHVNGESKGNALLESHVMIFPSFTEGLPNVLLEAMLFGMPVISSSVGGIPEVIKPGINGYLTESFDPEIFAAYLADICTDFNLYKTIANTNHKTAVERFTSEQVKQRIMNIFSGREDNLDYVSNPQLVTESAIIK